MPPADATDSQAPTRDRILTAAVSLFAQQGYEATTVGEIEEAAGLVPRSGGLYKHFPSKRALLDAALARRLDEITSLDQRIEMLPLEDLRSELQVLARISLAELERERDLARIVMKEGHRFPEVAAAFHEIVVKGGHAIAAAWVADRAERLGARINDTEAAAQVLTDALVGNNLQHAIFGEMLETIERERFVAAWVDIAEAAFRSVIDGPPNEQQEESP